MGCQLSAGLRGTSCHSHGTAAGYESRLVSLQALHYRRHHLARRPSASHLTRRVTSSLTAQRASALFSAAPAFSNSATSFLYLVPLPHERILLPALRIFYFLTLDDNTPTSHPLQLQSQDM
jgi:hypothetical protein